jgi:hypothetical protein
MRCGVLILHATMSSNAKVYPSHYLIEAREAMEESIDWWLGYFLLDLINSRVAHEHFLVKAVGHFAYLRLKQLECINS